MFKQWWSTKEQTPLISNHLIEKRLSPWHMPTDIQVLALAGHKNVAGLNLLMRFQPWPSYIDSLPLKMSTHYYKNEIKT